MLRLTTSKSPIPKKAKPTCLLKCFILFVILFFFLSFLVLSLFIHCSTQTGGLNDCNAISMSRESMIQSDSFRWFIAWLNLDRMLPRTPENILQELGLPHELPHFCSAKARFGNYLDGGWNVCLDPIFTQVHTQKELWSKLGKQKWPAVNSKCVIYSFGSNYDFSFEYALSRLDCEIHTFDPSMPSFQESDLKESMGIQFHHVALGPSTLYSNFKTLKEIMLSLGHNELEIVKIDIEGDEWAALENIFASNLKIRQLILEVHFLKTTIEQAIRVFRKFPENGYVLWSRVDNREGSWIIKFGGHYLFHAIELSFVKAAVLPVIYQQYANG